MINFNFWESHTLWPEGYRFPTPGLDHDGHNIISTRNTHMEFGRHHLEYSGSSISHTIFHHYQHLSVDRTHHFYSIMAPYCAFQTHVVLLDEIILLHYGIDHIGMMCVPHTIPEEFRYAGSVPSYSFNTYNTHINTYIPITYSWFHLCFAINTYRISKQYLYDQLSTSCPSLFSPSHVLFICTL